MKILELLRKKGVMRAQVATAMLFIISFIVLMILFIFAAPMATHISAYVTKAGVEQLEEANAVFAQIQDENVAATLTESTTAAKDTMITTSQLGIYLSKYGWVLVLVIVLIVMYLRSRMITEYERRGLV